MSRLAHNDAPQIDPLTQRIYDLVVAQAPVADVKQCLSEDFDLVTRLKTAPGYVQPNGFVTFKLGGVQGDQLLRLHYWPDGMSELGENCDAHIHDHVFGFTSLVLDGDGPMINTLYNEPAPDAASDLNLYQVDYTSPLTSNIKKLGDHFSASVKNRQSIAPGAYYTMSPGIFHTSEIESNAEAITLLATRLDEKVICPRFLDTEFKEMDYKRPSISDTLREKTIARLQNALKI